MKVSVLALMVSLNPAGFAAASAACAVNVGAQPVVMRIGKDEFRIAFAVNSDACKANGCNGTIRYQASWKTEDGATSIDRKLLSYSIPDGATRSIAVDRHYFDTAEGKHTTDIVRVQINEVSCARS